MTHTTNDRLRGYVRPILRIAIVVAGAAIVAMGMTSVASERAPRTDVPPGLEAAVARALADDECTDAATAASRLGGGLEGWTVVAAPGVETSACVSAAFDPSEKSIVLIPVTAPSVRQAVLAAGEELRERCLSRTEAVDFLRTVLAEQGVRDVLIRTDGPLTHPVGEGDAVRAHVAAGCFVYSVSGRSADGQLVYYLTGATD